MSKIALIIGASSGIGLASAKKLQASGYTVYNGSRSHAEDERIVSLTVDVTDRKTLKQAVDVVRSREGKLDLLVYSAGYSMAAPVEYAAEGDYRYLFEVNFFGAIAAVQEALPLLKESGGKIILISSLGGVLPIAYDAFYSASKAALNLFFEELNLETAQYGVHATCVLAGGTKTPFTRRRNIYAGADNGDYADGVSRAAGKLAEIEQNGMEPEEVAETVYKIAERTSPPELVAPGMSNKLMHMASRLLPNRAKSFLLKKTYRTGAPLS